MRDRAHLVRHCCLTVVAIALVACGDDRPRAVVDAPLAIDASIVDAPVDTPIDDAPIDGPMIDAPPPIDAPLMNDAAPIDAPMPVTTCGDGTVDPSEACDDGNVASGDGCDADCAWTCGDRAGLPGPRPHRVAVDGFNASCYAAYAVAVDFDAGAAFCAARGAHLATIVADHEQVAVGAALGTLASAWLGANDRSVEATFVWSTGEDLGFTAWIPGQPAATGDCLEVAAGGWRDRACAAPSNVVCEFDRLPTAQQVTSLVYADLTIGDLDGDGDLDFAGNHDFTTGLNDGHGTFTQRLVPSVPAETPTYTSTLADLDNDGDLDLVRLSQNFIFVSFNDGTGAFSGIVSSPLPGGFFVTDPEIGDIDGDGLVDLVIGDNFNARFAVFRNTGGGTFAAGVLFTTAHYATTLELVRWTSDAKLDVIVGENTASSLAVFRNDTLAPGAIALTAIARLPLPVAPRWLVAGDFDEDGAPDVVAIGEGVMTLHRGNGAGGTLGSASFAVPGAGVVRAVTGDLDGDHHQDIAIESQTASVTSVFYGTGTGSFAPPRFLAHTRFGFFDLAIGDAQGDGIDDLFVIAAGQPQLVIYRGTPGRAFPDAIRTSVARPAAIASGDFTGDGRADLAIGNDLGVTLQANASGFTTITTMATAAVVALRTGDFDNNGTLDIVAATTAGITVLLGNGSGMLVVSIAAPLTGVADLQVADFDGNGTLDVIVARSTGTAVVFDGDGFGDLSLRATLPIAPAAGGLVVADFTDDGVVDIVTTSGASTNLTVIRGLVAGAFATPVTVVGGADVSRAIAAGDFDNDGLQDVALGLPGFVSLLHGTGAGTFTTVIDDHGGDAARIVVADVDRDGQDDVVYAAGNAVFVARHRPDGYFTDPFERYASRAVDLVVDDFGRGLEVITVEADLGGIGIYEDGWY